MEQMEKSGCRVGDNFVKAVVCTGPVAGGFTKGRGVNTALQCSRALDFVNLLMLSFFCYLCCEDHCVQ